MLHRNIWVPILALISVLGFVGCGGPTKTEGSCTTNADCDTGERCVRQICKKYLKPDEPPTAVVGKNQRLRLNSTAEVDGSKSSDPEGTKLTYAWTFSKRPEQSKASITNADKAKASLKADTPGLYIMQLVVKDAKGQASRPARVEIEFYGKDENGDPIANAGADTIGCVGDKVTLNGTTSSDPDGDSLEYRWSFKIKPDGSTATLDDPAAEKPSFTADKVGKYIIELVVGDGLEESPADPISIQVLSDCSLLPKLSALTPNEGFIDEKVQVKVVGEAFSEQASVLFNGTVVPESEVTFVSPSELNVRLSLSGLVAKVYQVKVRNPNQKESSELPFTVKDLPIPVLTKLSPESGVSGAKMEIKATGTGFTKKSEALFNLVPLKTKYASETEISFTLDLSQTLPGLYKVKVQNPGGRNSKEMDFKVVESGPAPILNVLNPPLGITNTKIPFSVHGIGFAAGSVIYFDGKKIPSKRIRRDEIQADPVLDLTGVAEGSYKVYVRSPDGKVSKELSFLVEGIDPTPTLDRILPFFVYLDDAYNKIGVYGLKFRKGLKIKIGTNEISGADILYKSSTYVEANVDTTKGTWAEGDMVAVVINPSGKTSAPFKLTVTYRIPSISNLSPSGWTTGCDIEVSVHGTNFIPNSQVKLGTLTFTPTSTTNKVKYVSNKLLQFTLKKATLSAGTHTVQVINATKAKSQGTTSFLMTDQASVPKPEIREIRPSTGRADTKASILVYYNSNNRFWNGAVVYLDGKPQKTTCSSSGSTCNNLSADLDLSGLKPGKHDLVVKNPCGKDSDKFPFYVAEAPEPYISSISPSFARPGEKKKFVITGIHFSKNAKLSWGGTFVPVTWKSDKELLTSDIDFATAKAGDVIDVFVDNGNSKKTPVIKFSILDKNTKLYITSLSTKEFERGVVHNGLQISGGGFTQASEIYFNGKKVTTKFVSLYQVVADGLDFKTLAVGSYELYVKDGTNTSNKVILFAKPKREPLLDYIRPALIYAKSAPISSFYLYGKYFCDLPSPTSRTCAKNPKVRIIGPNNVDVSSSFTISYVSARSGWSYNGYVRGPLNPSSWAVGDYKVYFELPTGERSIAALLHAKLPPAPTLTRSSPGGMKKGASGSVSLYGTYLVKGGSALVGLQSFLSTGGSTTGSTYMKVTINTTNLAEGTHQLIYKNPDGQASNSISFTVYPKITPPLVRYTSPDVAYAGYSGSLYVYGENILSTTKLYVNGKEITGLYHYKGSSYSYLRKSGWVAPPGNGDYKIHLVDSLLNKSNVFLLGNAAAKGPFIRYISPDYRYSSTPTYSRSLYIYGFGFDSTSQIMIDGLAFTPTYRGSRYIRRTHTFSGYKNYKVQVKNSNGTLSNEAIFSFIPLTGLRITSSSPSSVTAGVSKYAAGRAYVYGANFKQTSKIYLNGKALKTRYSATNRLYVDEALDFTANTKAELWHWEVRDGTAKSNTKYLRIETGLSRLSRSRFTLVEPYVVSLNKKVELKCLTNYIYSDTYLYFQAVIVGQGLTKTYPISYINGRYTINIDTTGWKVGAYSVHAENKNTKIRSGGTGLFVIK